MKPPQVLTPKPNGSLSIREWPCNTIHGNRVYEPWRSTVRFPVFKTFGSMPTNSSLPITTTTATTATTTTTTTSTSDIGADVLKQSPRKGEGLEEGIEKVIYRCRFLTFFAVLGSLMGSLLCFVKGCTYVATSFRDYFVSEGKVILTLVEAIDVYLLGTVMMVFGMGLYELFISNLDIGATNNRSNLFGLFTLKERPKWLEINSVNELKTKLGHVIVMVLLVGLFEKTKRIEISTTQDLLCFAASILLSSGCLYLLSKLTK